MKFRDASTLVLLLAEPVMRRKRVLRENAVRFLRVHALRAGDALQLAAAFIAAERRPASLDLVTLDERLADAARKEGFSLIEVTPG